MREAARKAGALEALRQPLARPRCRRCARLASSRCIRLKAPLTGETVIEDQVQGRVVWQNENLDDFDHPALRRHPDLQFRRRRGRSRHGRHARDPRCRPSDQRRAPGAGLSGAWAG